MSNSRSSRVAEQIQQEVARLLMRGAIKDPRVGFVTITGAEIDRELRRAVIFYSLMGDEAQHADTQKGLESAAGFLRREVAKNLKMRHTPELAFKFDASVEQGDRIERLLREVKASDKKPDGGSEK
jgi:ribosome-binding factor A